jgi:hypothetical protein
MKTPLSSSGLTGRPSIPETFEIKREAAAYWIARSSRATTRLVVAGALLKSQESEGYYFRRRRCWPSPIFLASAERATA